MKLSKKEEVSQKRKQLQEYKFYKLVKQMFIFMLCSYPFFFGAVLFGLYLQEIFGY
ncbi:MAG: hypothetical protein H7647_06865 [Candidatus Heimdallarchaeota archaeon]|nr:hypothetical protein [Candidatus Heimdallarchaeota archaeon]